MTIQSGTNQSTGMPETADYKMLYQQLKIKHQFMLSQVSHEIRNPVTDQQLHAAFRRTAS